MSTLSSVKKDFDISDDMPIEYEQIEDELILHIPLRKINQRNKNLIKQARELVQQRGKSEWSRDKFFDDFMSVRDKVLEEIRDHYGEN